MTSEQATVAVIEALDSLGISYMLVGSLSSNYYGIARSTQDADFVVQLQGVSIGAIIKRLGPRFNLEPQMSFEMIQASTRYVLKLESIPFQVELFLLGNDEYDQERFNRRRHVNILSRQICIPTPEDVIVTKLRWSQHGRRIKDRDDVRNILMVQANRLDWNYINRWCIEFGIKELLDDVCKSLENL